MAKRSANKGLRGLADEVLQYLINHEGACDTVEGIVAWWLPVQRIETAVVEVNAALRDLVDREYVIQRKGTDGRIHYRMNPEREPAIRRWLATKMAQAHRRATLPTTARKRGGTADR